VKKHHWKNCCGISSTSFKNTRFKGGARNWGYQQATHLVRRREIITGHGWNEMVEPLLDVVEEEEFVSGVFVCVNEKSEFL
jgi:hypothetical protein